jgi:gluconokinase
MAAKRNVVLGVEVSASTVTVTAVGDDLSPLETVVWPLRPRLDATAYRDVVFSALREAVGVCAVFGRRVVGISLGVRDDHLIALDRRAQPLTSLFGHSEFGCPVLARQLHDRYGDELRRRTGVVLRPTSPLPALAWVASNDRGLHQGAAYWSGLKPYLLAELTGRLVGDVSSWSANGMVDQDDLSWSGLALEIAGLAPDRLPELVEPTEVLRLNRRAAQAIGLARGTPVVPGSSAAALSHVGAGTPGVGSAVLSMEDVLALSVVRGAPEVPPSEHVGCHWVADGLWLVHGSVGTEFGVERWASVSFGEMTPEELLAEAEQVPVGSEGLLGIPSRTGARGPWLGSDMPGALVGLRADHSRAAITRAMVEGIAQQVALIADDLAVEAPITSVRALGSSLRSPLWSTVLAAALDRTLELVETASSVAFGAAVLAWRGLGRLRPLGSDPELVPAGQFVVPDPYAVAHLAATRPLTAQLSKALSRARTLS